MLLGSRINWPRCQMHVKTVAMQLFLPLFGMLGHGTFPLAQALRKAGAVVHQFPRVVQHTVKDLLRDSVESACEMSAPCYFPEVGCSG